VRYLEPDELLLLVAAALRDRVVPDCGPAARGQTWAAIGILENLATRIAETSPSGEDDLALSAGLETPEGWQRALDVVRRREARERELRRPTYFGEIFRRDADDADGPPSQG
jgi:hypothetical protein